MSEVRLIPLTGAAASDVAAWFVDDVEGQRRFGGFYGVHPKWWNLVTAGEQRHGWIARLENQAIGFVDIDVEANQSHVAFYLRKRYRGQGLGVPLLRAAVAEARELGIRRLTASVELDNLSSLACCRGAGFTDAGMNKYGENVLICELA